MESVLSQRMQENLDILKQNDIKFKLSKKDNLIGIFKNEHVKYYFDINNFNWFVWTRYGYKFYKSKGIEDFINRFYNNDNKKTDRTRIVKGIIIKKQLAIIKLQEKIESINQEISKLNEELNSLT